MLSAFSAKDYGADAGHLAPTLRAMTHSGSRANGGGQIAVCIQEGQTGVREHATAGTVRSGAPGSVPLAVEGRRAATSKNFAGGPCLTRTVGSPYAAAISGEIRGVMLSNRAVSRNRIAPAFSILPLLLLRGAPAARGESPQWRHARHIGEIEDGVPVVQKHSPRALPPRTWPASELLMSWNLQ